jgi:hypothetical protein
MEHFLRKRSIAEPIRPPCYSLHIYEPSDWSGDSWLASCKHAKRVIMMAVRSANRFWTKAAARAFSSKVPEITTVGIVGMGLMGHGIAQVAASNGFKVLRFLR